MINEQLATSDSSIKIYPPERILPTDMFLLCLYPAPPSTKEKPPSPSTPAEFLAQKKARLTEVQKQKGRFKPWEQEKQFR